MIEITEMVKKQRINTHCPYQANERIVIIVYLLYPFKDRILCVAVVIVLYNFYTGFSI